MLNISGALYIVAIDLHDYVAALQAGVVGRTARLHLFDHSSMNRAGSLQLLAKVRGHVGKAKSPMHFAVRVFPDFAVVFVTASHRFESDWDSRVFAFANDFQLNCRARTLLSNFDL